MRRVYLTIGIVLLLTIGVVVAEEQGRGPKGPARPRMGRDGDGVGIVLRTKEKLGLSEEQVEQLKKLREEVKGKFKASSEAMKSARESLHEVVQAGASEAEIRGAAYRIGEAIGNQAVLKVSTRGKINAILTDDQEAKLEEFRERRMRMGMGKDKDGPQKPKKVKEGEGPRKAGGMFSRIDADGDGVISPEEFEGHMQQMKERREKGGRGGGRSEHPKGRSEHPKGNSEHN